MNGACIGSNRYTTHTCLVGATEDLTTKCLNLNLDHIKLVDRIN